MFEKLIYSTGNSTGESNEQSINFQRIILSQLNKISKTDQVIPNTLVNKVVKIIDNSVLHKIDSNAFECLLNVSRKNSAIPTNLIDTIEKKLE